VTVTAPIDVNTHHEGTLTSDDLVILDDLVAAQAVSIEAVAGRDPAMVLVYVGILSLIVIFAVSALLAL